MATTLFELLKNNIFKIITLIIAFFSLRVFNELQSMGILIDLISIDTFTATINIVFTGYLVAIAIIIIPVILYMMLPLLIDKISKKTICKASIRKWVSGSIVIAFIVALFLLFIFTNDRVKDIAETYIFNARQPTLRTIYINDTNSTKDVLLIGNDDAFIHYIDSEDIKHILKDKLHEEVCKPYDLNKSSYIDSIIKLLKMSDAEGKQISTQRYHMLKIDQIQLADENPNLGDVFCNDSNTSVNKETR